MTTTYRVPGAILTEREHSVPLDHGRPEGPRITVFTREVSAPDGAARPYLLFLQGGPGIEATRPTSPPSGWMYLTHFRADSIVRDAEHIRRELGVERWSVLGQSFGGFTSMTYLSLAPEGLREAIIEHNGLRADVSGCSAG